MLYEIHCSIHPLWIANLSFTYSGISYSKIHMENKYIEETVLRGSGGLKTDFVLCQ